MHTGTPHFRLRSFGRVALLDDSERQDRSLATRPRKLAVLTWLALRPHARASRDRIIGTFWAERDEERARNSLSDAVSHLRRVLGRDAIQTVGNDVAIALDRITIDANQLAAAAAAGDHERVVAIYEGPFLDGFYIADAPEFCDWRDRERARFAGLFAKSAAVRCATLATAGEWEECRRLAERWVDAEPASADAALALLSAVAAPGTHAARAEVIRVYGMLMRRLENDVGIPAAPAVTAFVHQIEQELAATPVLDLRPAAIDAAPVEGVVRRSKRLSPRTRWMASVGAAALGVALITFAFVNRASRAALPRRVVVAPFENRTGDSTFAPLGRVAADWISRGLADTRQIDVVDPLSTTPGDFSNPRMVARRTGAAFVVVGTYAQQGDSLAVDARLIDASSGRVVRAIVPASASKATPLIAVSIIRQRVAGAIAAEVDPLLRSLVHEATQPPTYEAYLAWVEGLDRFSHRFYQAAVPFLLRAAALDSNFVAPKIWAAAALGNAGDYARCDSILRSVAPLRDRFAPLDRGLADYWTATLRGDFAGRYVAGHEMLALAPNSDLALYAAGRNAIEVNRPVEAIEVLKRIHPDESGVPWDVYGTKLPLALHLASRHREELAETERRLSRQPTSVRALEERANALAALGRFHLVEQTIDEILALPEDSSRVTGTMLFGIGEELATHDHPAEAKVVFGRIVAWIAQQPADVASDRSMRAVLAASLLELGNDAAADSVLAGLLAERPSAVAYLSEHGLIAARRHDRTEAERMSRALATLHEPYLNGANTFGRARIAIVLGERDAAVRLARQARAEGLSIMRLHSTAEMRLLRGYAPFDALTKPMG
jgi:DNA-binding SARP family transcriptional activator/TolB-like protein/tetratricopeptide (TPR) repeat protein